MLPYVFTFQFSDSFYKLFKTIPEVKIKKMEIANYLESKMRTFFYKKKTYETQLKLYLKDNE